MIDNLNINEIIKNGGATLTKELENANFTSGFMVSILGMERIYNKNGDLEQLKKDIKEYQKILKNNAI